MSTLGKRLDALEAAAGPSALTVWRQIARDLGLPFSPAQAFGHEARVAELYGEGLAPANIARAAAADLGVSFEAYKRALIHAVEVSAVSSGVVFRPVRSTCPCGRSTRNSFARNTTWQSRPWKKETRVPCSSTSTWRH